MAEKRTRPAEPDAKSDRLGKPLARYTSTVRSIVLIVLAVILGLSGGAVVGGADALAWNLAQSQDGLPYAIVGWVLVATGGGMVACGVWFLGRSFEIRRKGVRFTSGPNVTELRWDEIDHIDVHKTIIYYRGARQGERWEIFIHGGIYTIHLTPSFLKLVRSVTEVVSLLKLHSGKEIEMPPLV